MSDHQKMTMEGLTAKRKRDAEGKGKIGVPFWKHQKANEARKKGGGKGQAFDKHAEKKLTPAEELLLTLNKLWAQLMKQDMQTKAKAKERRQICDDLYQLCEGKFLQLALKHDASRTLQALYSQGSPAQQTSMVEEVKSKLRELCMSKFGRRLVMKMIQGGQAAQRAILLKELTPWTTKLLTHKVGAKVVDQMFEVANAAQRKQLLLQCCGREVLLLDDGAGAKAATAAAGKEGGAGAKKAGGQGKAKTVIGGVLERQPSAKTRILARLHETLCIVIHKECLHSRLACELFMEYAAHAEHKQLQDLIASAAPLCAQIAQQGPTKQGERVLMHIVGYGSAKDRKTIMRGLHGKFGDLARQEFGHRIVMRLLDVVDDTTMLGKTVMDDIGAADTARMVELCSHKYGRRPLLHVLAPRSRRYFDQSTIALMAAAMVPAPSKDGEDDSQGRLMPTSKKDPEVRRGQVLAGLRKTLQEWCEARCGVALCSTLEADVLLEILRNAAAKGSAFGDATPGMLQQVADAALAPAPGGSARDGSATDMSVEGAEELLLNHYVASKQLKRLVVDDVGGFAAVLLEALEGAEMLPRVALLKGGRFLVAALLKNEALHERVAAALAAEKGKGSWAKDEGCKRLFAEAGLK